jgi:hypothetical protein
LVVSARRIIGPIFFNETAYADRYAKNIVRSFLAEIAKEEKLYFYFQQDSVMAYTAHVNLEELRKVVDARIISRRLWPPSSPDLTPCDFYLWGSLEDKVYKRNPHTLEELRNNIRREAATISGEELQRVNNNAFRRYMECIRSGGQYFQHLL